MKHEQFLCAGFGGQGILMMGTILAQAGMMEGKRVTWFPSYGPAMRGGTANCSVIVSPDEIASPIISHPDCLVAMNEESYRRFAPDVKKGGMVLYNDSLVVSRPGAKTGCSYRNVSASGIADDLGSIKVANMVMLGALVRATGVITMATVKAALKEILPSGKHHLLQLNEQALDDGFSSV